MKTITVDQSRLRETLETNMEAHRAKFEEALVRYREAAVEAFEKNIEEVRRGGPVRQHLALPVPEEHTKDYQQAIDMLDWDNDDTVELTRDEFAQYVNDDWSWGQSFATNSLSYTQNSS